MKGYIHISVSSTCTYVCIFWYLHIYIASGIENKISHIANKYYFNDCFIYDTINKNNLTGKL